MWIEKTEAERKTLLTLFSGDGGAVAGAGGGMPPMGDEPPRKRWRWRSHVELDELTGTSNVQLISEIEDLELLAIWALLIK